MTLKDLQWFLEFATYYRKFSKIFSELAKLLTNRTKKRANVAACGADTVESFAKMKQYFTSAPILIQPNLKQPFIVKVDACEIVVGPVMFQGSTK